MLVSALVRFPCEIYRGAPGAVALTTFAGSSPFDGGPTRLEEDGRTMASGDAAGEAEVLCVGEVLWDALPAGLFLGGAPFNVACHLRAAGVPVSLVSRVGDDRLGAEARARVVRYGVRTDLVQVDPRLPTGFANHEEFVRLLQ